MSIDSPEAAVADTTTNVLLEPWRLGDLVLPNRVLMAPLTRSRSWQPGDVPWAMNAEYYRQRAAAGLIISEATQVSPQGKGYAFTPGLHSDEQVEGWRLVTDAVHAAGGRIFAQLWHVGRISNTALQPDGAAPVAPSAVRASAHTYIDAESGRVPVSEPRALERDEIPSVVDQFRRAAINAKNAGFDGVEIHGANGYLLDQFLRDRINLRTDDYGDSVENRCRFCLDVAEAVTDVWPACRVGYRVSPMSSIDDISPDTLDETFTTLARALGGMGLAYIHVVEAFRTTARDERSEHVYAAVRDAFRNAAAEKNTSPHTASAYIGNGDYTPERAARRIQAQLAVAVAFGKLFISNPDLPERVRRGGPYAQWDESTFYTGDHRGYTDYPTLGPAWSPSNA